MIGGGLAAYVRIHDTTLTTLKAYTAFPAGALRKVGGASVGFVNIMATYCILRPPETRLLEKLVTSLRLLYNSLPGTPWRPRAAVQRGERARAFVKHGARTYIPFHTLCPCAPPRGIPCWPGPTGRLTAPEASEHPSACRAVSEQV